MIAIYQERANFWLRIKLLLTLKGGAKPNTPAPPKPKRPSHRASAFFQMP